MAWETIYYIGQTVAVVAIVLSLIFVGVQIRQNTAQSKADAAEAAHRSFLDWYYNQNSEHGELFARAQVGFETLSAKERYLHTANVMPFLMNLQEAHIKWLEGSLVEDRWRFWDQFATIVSVPESMKEIWKERRFMFSDDFQAYFDEKLRNKANVPVSDASWMSAVGPDNTSAPEAPQNEESNA
ncbi:MAG: hypothetical protein AAGF33_17465 [Pseudomonadota bacterium]